jgi:uncharacterized protein (TIGR02466 family)
MEPDAKPELVFESFFPTRIYRFDAPDAAELNAALKPRIYALRTRDPEGIGRSNFASWHSHTKVHQLEEFRFFTERLQEVVRRVFEAGGHARPPSCNDLWVNVTPRHGGNRSHVHSGSLLSGVYWVQAPEGSGSLSFDDPRAQALVLLPILTEEARNRPENWARVFFKPVEGRFLLFPAWLRHEVEANEAAAEGAAGDRISISFNFSYQD